MNLEEFTKVSLSGWESHALGLQEEPGMCLVVVKQVPVLLACHHCVSQRLVSPHSCTRKHHPVTGEVDLQLKLPKWPITLIKTEKKKKKRLQFVPAA